MEMTWGNFRSLAAVRLSRSKSGTGNEKWNREGAGLVHRLHDRLHSTLPQLPYIYKYCTCGVAKPRSWGARTLMPGGLVSLVEFRVVTIGDEFVRTGGVKIYSL